MVRSATLAAFFLAASAAGAQTPDTTAAHRYLPLPVGAVWQYDYWWDDCTLFPVCHAQYLGSGTRRVVGDSLVGTRVYAVVRAEGLAAEGSPTGSRIDLVRFDTTAAHGVVRREDGTEAYWPSPILRCRMDEPFDAQVECEGGMPAFVAAHTFNVRQGSQPATIGTKLFVLGGVAEAEYGVGLGLIQEVYGDIGGSWVVLSAARVGTLNYGTVTAAEAGPTSSSPGLRVLPNPVRGRATLHLALPVAGAVRVEAYDAMGRRVYAAEMGAQSAGTSVHAIDVASWAPGVYVVRVTTADGQTATARLVRAE